MYDLSDVYGELAQREKDLVLAAELGKALLEKNEQISRDNERLAEEFSQKLEALEQDKHGLRRKLDTLQSEYDSRVSELQGDLRELRKEIERRTLEHRNSEKEKGQLIQELAEQNHRLTATLKQAAQTEHQLQSQLQSLREQFNVRRSNLHDHVSQLEGLREEINLLSSRKSSLEQRISALSDEREGLNVSLEESGDRILLLEKQNREQEQQLRLQQRDISELRATNSQLQSRLEAVLRRGGEGNHPSLYNELGCIGFPEDEIECDDSAMESEQSWKLQESLVPIYVELRGLCDALRRHSDSGISDTPREVRIGMLAALTKELGSLLQMDESAPCRSVSDALAKVQKELSEKNDLVGRNNEQVAQLTAKLTLQETELSVLRESRDQLKSDVGDAGLAKDQVVKKAWEVRDKAVARKNFVEIELSRSRIEAMHLNSQLMEAVQQKVELSQQLEQWKMDMEALLDSQVTKKLKTQEQTDKPPPSKSKLFRLWR